MERSSDQREPGKSYVIVSGVFSYMKGYKLDVRSVQVLNAPADRPASFTVVGRETKGITVPLEKRPVISVEDAARPQPAVK